MISVRSGSGLSILHLFGVLVLALANKPTGTRWSLSPAPVVDLGTVTATPMRGKYRQVFDDNNGGYPPYPVAPFSVGEVIGAELHPRLESLLVEAAINRYVSDGATELAVRTAAPLDGSGEGGDWFRLDLGHDVRVDHLGYSDVFTAHRLGELFVRTSVNGEEMLHVCAIGPSRIPSCAQVRLRSPTSHFHVEIASDLTITVRGHDGATPVHLRYRLEFR